MSEGVKTACQDQIRTILTKAEEEKKEYQTKIASLEAISLLEEL